MTWTNAQYIRRLDDARYLEFIKPFMGKALDLSKYDDKTLLDIALLYKDEIGCGNDIIAPLTNIISPSEVEGEEEKAMLALDTTPKVFKALIEELNGLKEVNPENIKQVFKNVQNAIGVKGKALYMPVRLALTGVSHGIELVNIIKILGKEEVIARLSK